MKNVARVVLSLVALLLFMLMLLASRRSFPDSQKVPDAEIEDNDMGYVSLGVDSWDRY